MKNDDTIDMSLISETVQTVNQPKINDVIEELDDEVKTYDITEMIDELKKSEHRDSNEVSTSKKKKQKRVRDKKKKVRKPKKEHDKPVKKTKKTSKLVKAFIVLDVLVAICFFITYGPINYLRNLLVTTAMETTSHKYLARIFYNEQTILKIIGQNHIENFQEGSDPSQIVFEENTSTTYESKYEEQILKKDPGNDLYKVIELEGKNYKGHMIVIYDPSRIELVQSKFIDVGGQKLPSLAADHDAKVAINASGFTSIGNALKCIGAFIIDGKIVSTLPGERSIIGFDQNNVLVLSYESAETAIEKGIVDAVEFGPFLVVNGQKASIKGNGGGLAPRTAIGQRKDGIVLMVTVDGRRVGHSLGINLNDLAEIFMTYKAYNAANLDGGGSSSMVVEGEMINVPGGYGYVGSRYLPNAWVVK